MSITYEQLYNLNLSQLNKAVEAWRETARKAEQLQHDASEDLVRPFKQAGWSSGDLTSTLAEKTVTDVERELEDAHNVAKAIHSILEESHATLRAKKTKLRELVAEETASGEVRISPTGDITCRGREDGGGLPYAPGASDNNAHFSPAAAQQRVNAVARRIQKILEEATEADDSAAAAIRYNIGSDSNNYHGRTAGKVEVAEHRYDSAQALKRAQAAEVWKSDGKTTATGLDAGASVTGPGYGKQGMAKAYADLGHATAEGSLTSGDVKLSGIGDAYAGARTTASAGITDAGISGNAEASAGARALAEGRAEAGHFGTYGRATGFAGGEAGVTAGAGPDGLKVGGEAFAGAKGSVAGGVEAGGIGAGATAEGWAGPGAEAKLTFGKDDEGVYRFAPKVGISPALGGAVGFEFTVDPSKVADAAGDAADSLGNSADRVGDTVGSVKDTVTDLF